MKINLLLDNPNDVMSGYLNIDPVSGTGEDGYLREDIDNFDTICEDSEAVEIVATELLAYFPAKDVDRILTYWLRKLKHGGVLKLTDVDLIEATKGIANRTLSLNDANLLIYGHQDKPWRYRKCLLTMTSVVDVLKSKGLRIVKKRLDNFQFYVEAQRP